MSRLAGVSRMTVSRVLSRPELVLPETRERVLEAVAALGYLPDRAAGALATRRTGFVALLLPTLTNSNFAAVAQGLTEALRPAGYELLIGYTGYDTAEEARQVRQLLARRPEAVVLSGHAGSPEALAALQRAAVPVVSVAELVPGESGFTVGFSNFAAGRAAAQHLLGLGHRCLAALGPARLGTRHDRRGEERLAGFAAMLDEAGLPPAPVLRLGVPPLSFEQGAAAMAALLERVPEVRAVFAVSDLVATGALMECARRGIAVPGDVSLIGFGDFEIGRQVVPALSTVAVDFAALGHRAGALLTELLRGATPADPVVDVGFRVVQRGSTAAASVLPAAGAAPRG